MSFGTTGISYGMSTIGIGSGNIIKPLQPLSALEGASIDALRERYADNLNGLDEPQNVKL
jgi:hypothetical protein